MGVRIHQRQKKLFEGDSFREPLKANGKGGGKAEGVHLCNEGGCSDSVKLSMNR